MNDLLIKGTADTEFRNGYDYYHVKMGQGFLNTLEASLQLKEPIENDSRIEDGVRIIVTKKKAKRSIMLKFNIHGSTTAEYMTNKQAFENMLYQGVVDIKVNNVNHPDIYHLVYTGKSVTYNRSYNGVFGVVVMQFIEPNPGSRTSTANPHIRVLT